MLNIFKTNCICEPGKVLSLDRTYCITGCKIGTFLDLYGKFCTTTCQKDTFLNEAGS